MAPDPNMLAALDSFGAEPPPAPGGGPGEPVYCQVCATTIDNKTGAPLEPVGPEQVEAVMAAAGMGGPAPGGAPPAPPLPL